MLTHGGVPSLILLKGIFHTENICVGSVTKFRENILNQTTAELLQVDDLSTTVLILNTDLHLLKDSSNNWYRCSTSMPIS